MLFENLFKPRQRRPTGLRQFHLQPQNHVLSNLRLAS
ncbi:DNA alkylation repair protein [Streptococcus pneumoniae]|nr:DNA alkylation repair protein [Streptococcus pneumoniae]